MLSSNKYDKSSNLGVIVPIYENNNRFLDRFSSASSDSRSSSFSDGITAEQALVDSQNPASMINPDSNRLSSAARTALKEQFFLPPNNFGAEKQLLELALMHFEQGNIAEALHLMKRAWNSVIEYRSKNFEADFASVPFRNYAISYARILLQSGERNTGRQILDRLVEANPDWSEPLELLFQSYLEAKSFFLAEKTAKALISVLGAAKADGYNSLILVLHAQGKVPEALENLKYAQSLFPQNAELNNWHGLFLFYNGEVTEACEKFRMAHKLRPAVESSTYNYGVCLLIEGKMEEALQILDMALAAKPASVALRFLRGETKLRLGQLGDARKDWREFLQLADFSDARVSYVKNVLQKGE